MPIATIIHKTIIWRGLLYFSTFILNVLIARHFEAAVTGNIYYLINMYSLVHLVCSLSMESGIIYYGSKTEVSPGKLISISILWTLLIIPILGLGMVILIKSSYQNISRQFLIISGITFVFGNLLFHYGSALFYSQKNFLVPNLIGFVFNALLILILPFNIFSLMPVINDDNYFYFYFTSFVAQGICIIIAFLWFTKTPFRISLPAPEEFIKLLKFSLLAFSGNIAFFLLYRIDYWFVEKYCSSLDLGNYIQVSKLGQLFFMFPSILATAIFPLTASDEKNNIYNWLAFMSRSFLFFYAIVCLILILTGRWLFPFIFGDTYSSMYVAFIYLVPGILSLSTLYSLTAFNGGRNKLKLNIYGCLIALVVVFAGNVLIVPFYGINGAAAVSSLGYIVFHLYLLYEIKKEYQINLSSFFFFRISDFKTLKKIIVLKK